jgi:hypothetical protein
MYERVAAATANIKTRYKEESRNSDEVLAFVMD